MGKCLTITLAALVLATSCQRLASPPPEPFGPVPTAAQVAWQRMEINMFCHFGPNTFTGAEWGTGREAEAVFSPTALDCGQWVDVAAQAGMGGIILTAKHHDGFCLWPSQQSTHTVADSLDVLRALRTAIDRHNSALPATRYPLPATSYPLKMGVYISPWDRNHPAYGTDDYNAVFANTLREVHTQYGPLFEQWFDGACGEGPNGKRQVYDWPLFNGTVQQLSPQCVIFSDWGPGCRWVGNEEGRCDETCWSTLGDSAWVPAEADVSLRPGWFWHPQERPKTVDELMEIYYNSVGRNGLLLLNVPPDTAGRIAAEDSAVLVAFRRERDRIFAHDLAQGAKASAHHLRGRGYRAANVLDTAYHSYWAAADTEASITLSFDRPMEFDLIVLQEYIPLGQRVTGVGLLCDPEGDGTYSLRMDSLCTTVGHKRIVRLDKPLRCRSLMLTFSGLAAPVINRIAIYNSQTR